MLSKIALLTRKLTLHNYGSLILAVLRVVGKGLNPFDGSPMDHLRVLPATSRLC